jgi:hypothetical protein
MHGLDPHASSWRLTSRTVAQCTSEEVTAAMVHCFQGYLVPMRLTPERYEIRSRAENLDPFASKIYYSNGSPAAVAMIARRGWTSRLAAMAHRRQRWGSRMLGALEAHFTDRPLTVQALVPENIAPGFFHRAGWRRQALNQFEMKIEL